MAVFGVKQVIFGSVDDESSEERIIRFVHSCNNQQWVTDLQTPN